VVEERMKEVGMLEKSVDTEPQVATDNSFKASSS